jgi:hypothetical protein
MKFHNHNGTTRPDEKMGLRRRFLPHVNSTQAAVLKRRAAKKRRQRDKQVER